MTGATRGPIIVVGAGILGLSAALHLRSTTDRDVIVLDASDDASATTPAGAGFVAPWATVLPHLGRSGLALSQHSLNFYRGMYAEGVDISYRHNGNIVFFNDQASLDTSVAAIMAGALVTADTRSLTPAEIAEMTSDAVDSAAIAGGVFMPDGIQVETGKVLAHLAVLVEQAGAQIRRSTRLQTLVREAGRVRGVETTDSKGNAASFTTDSVVLAVGAWLNDVLEQVDWRLPLLPFVATRMVTEDVGLAPTMPTLQGKDFPLWIRESEGGFTWGTTPGAAPAHRLGSGWKSFDRAEREYPRLVEAELADVDRVAKVFPALRGAATIRVIQGMPVYTVDRQFFAGPVPSCEGLWVIGGDNESGVSHGPGLGRLVAEMVAGAEPFCDPTRYRLDRFSPREFADAEAVGQQFATAGEGFIAEAMRQPLDIT